jgi:hypothetical protein
VYTEAMDDQVRQKETVATLRNLGTALMSWLTDQVGAASAGATKTYSFEGFELRSHEEIVKLLKPSETFYYMKDVPEFDGWGNPLEVWLTDDLVSARVMVIRSPGKDGYFSDDALRYTISEFPAFDYDEDVVWADGYFLRWPAPGKR